MSYYVENSSQFLALYVHEVDLKNRGYDKWLPSSFATCIIKESL